MTETPGTTPTRSARVGRAAAASALGVLVALAAHLAGGGSAPPLALLVAAAVVVQPLAVLLAGRRPSLWRQAAVVGLGQLAMHAVFALGSPSGHVAVRAGAGMDGMPGMGGTAGAVDLSGLGPAHSPHEMGAMWGWHAAAWLGTTAAWRWGEAAVRVLLVGVARAVPRRLGPVLPVAGPVRLHPPVAMTSPAAVAVRRSHPRRGPPILR